MGNQAISSGGCALIFLALGVVPMAVILIGHVVNASWTNSHRWEVVLLGYAVGIVVSLALKITSAIRNR